MFGIKQYGILEITGENHNSSATSRDRTHFTQSIRGWLCHRFSLDTYDYRRMLPHSFSWLSTNIVTVMSTISYFLPISVFKSDAMYSGGWVGR